MYPVIWYNSALDALADAYVASDPATRDRIAEAVARLNVALADDSSEVGESRPGLGRRIAYELPCAIRFTIDAADGVVRVTHFLIV
jgi:hypothetical protein